jgi:hypothetical protein
MLPLPAVGPLAAPTDTRPPVTELVPVRVHGHDPGWPPVLVFCVVVLVLGALFAAVVFMRRAWTAAHPVRRSLDG